MQTVILLGTNSSLRVFVPWEKSVDKQSREFRGLIQAVCGELLAALVILAAFKQGVISVFFRDGKDCMKRPLANFLGRQCGPADIRKRSVGTAFRASRMPAGVGVPRGGGHA